MRTSAKAALTALVAALLLATAIGTATARNLSISSQNIRATWTSFEFERIGLITIRCRVTLEGSFHARTIAKSRESLIGAVTRVDVQKERCVEGQALAKTATLPWHLTYESFTGSLPNISAVSIGLSRFRFLVIRPGFATCEYGGLADTVIISAVLTGGEISSFTPVEGRNLISRVEPSTALCWSELRVRGTGALTVLNSTTRVRITLIM